MGGSSSFPWLYLLWWYLGELLDRVGLRVDGHDGHDKEDGEADDLVRDRVRVGVKIRARVRVRARAGPGPGLGLGLRVRLRRGTQVGLSSEKETTTIRQT